MKKRKKQNIILAIIAAVIISSVVGYNYYIDQLKVKGFAFGNQLQQIQEELKTSSEEFETNRIIWEEGELTSDEFSEYSEEHLEDLDKIIQKYNELDTPPPFIKSVELFRLSTESQIESTKEYILWLQTEDSSHKIRSDALFQESFDYEIAALGEFNAAKTGKSP